MAEFFADYGLFLLKTLTIVVAIVVIIGAAAAAGKKAQHQEGLEIENLNRKYRKLAAALKQAVMKKSDWKKEAKAEKEREKAEAKAVASRPRAFVIDFKGDLKASAVPSLREEVSAVLEVAGKDDQVLVRLENHGGVVHEHGLAASQLVRLRERGIPLTVVVDKVAASGGYLMACVADRILAAPFAILGSIGVLAQIPNFNRLLDDHGIDFEMITAGKYKRTVTMFGENTDEDREKTRQDLEEVHTLFKSAVVEHRPSLDIENVATGEYWYGPRARELGLIDEVGSSDDYLMRQADEAQIFAVTYKGREGFMQKLQGAFGKMAESLGIGPQLP